MKEETSKQTAAATTTTPPTKKQTEYDFKCPNFSDCAVSKLVFSTYTIYFIVDSLVCLLLGFNTSLCLR